MPPPTHLPDVWAQARALRDRGDLASARTLLEDNLDVAAFQYGEDHPDVLATSHLLATLYRRVGDLPGARRIVEEALQAGSQRLAEADPVMLRLSFELARIADQLGNRHEARKHYVRVAALGPAVEGLQDQAREAAASLGPPEAPSLPPSAPQPSLPQPSLPQPSLPQPSPPQPSPPQPSLPQPSLPHSPAPGVIAVPRQPDTVDQPPTPAHVHAPLPSLSGPVRFSDRPAEPPPAGEGVPRLAPVAAMPAQVFTAQPSVIVERRGRGCVVIAAVAALVAVAAAGLVVLSLLRPAGSGDTPAGVQSPDVSAPVRGPATGLVLADHGGEVTLTWNDPAEQKAAFAVKMGPTKDSMVLVTGNIGNKPSFTMRGLNAKYDYCFSIVTFYSGTEFYDSAPACTARTRSQPSSSKS